MSNIIFHIPFSIDPYRYSASQIRPIKMIEAFKSLGHEVFIIWGNNSERRLKYKELRKKIIEGVKFDFFYSESSTMPQMLTDNHHLPSSPLLEIKIFKFIKSQEIPIGLFYRDMHWKFNQYKKESTLVKRNIAKFFYQLDLWVYYFFVDVLFLPSKEMIAHLPGFLQNKKIFDLPPGHDIHLLEDRIYTGSSRCLYVGGIRPPLYDLSLLEKINEDVPINIICRREEWKEMYYYYKWAGKKNIKVNHSSGKELTRHYLSSDIFLLIWQPNKYLDFAMPMKIFEAIGYNIPVITKEGTLVAGFVNKRNIGWVYSNEDELNEIIKTLPLTYNEKLKNIKAISQEHHWNNRAKKVKEKLSAVNENFNSNRS